MDKPEGLEPKGEKLWESITSEVELDAAGYALLEEICRTADIIARLTKKLNSKHHEWVRLVEDVGYDGDGVKVIVVVDQVLSEIRQQRLAIRQMMQHLSIGRVKVKGGKSEDNFWAKYEAQFQD